MSLSSEELQRRALERKIQKTAAGLKASERQLPSSITKKESKLVPNNVSTNAFKQGLTLHSVLCGMEKVNMEKRTMSQENLLHDSPNIPPFYRNMSSSLFSPPRATDFLMDQTKLLSPNLRKPLSEWNAAAKKKQEEGIQIDEYGYAVPSSASTPRRSGIGKKPPCRRDGSNEKRKSEEYISAFEESFDTEEREKREHNSNLVATDRGGFSAIGSLTPVKKSLRNFDAIRSEVQNEEEREESSTLIQEWEGSEEKTLIGTLDQSVKELKEMLDHASEKADTAVGQLDKTLNETSIGGDGLFESDIGNRRSLTPEMKMKATQTPNKWKSKDSPQKSEIGGNKLDHRKVRATQPRFSIPLTKELTTAVERRSISSQLQFSARDEHIKAMNLREECKEVMRKHIETLRECLKNRALLIHRETRNLTIKERVAKFNALTDEFDATKRRIKAELRDKHADMKLVAKHYDEIRQLQKDSRLAKAKAERIRLNQQPKMNNSPSRNVFSTLSAGQVPRLDLAGIVDGNGLPSSRESFKSPSKKIGCFSAESTRVVKESVSTEPISHHSPRFVYNVRTQEPIQVEASVHTRPMETELTIKATYQEKVDKSVERSSDSVFEELESNSAGDGSAAQRRSQNVLLSSLSSPILSLSQQMERGAGEEEVVEVISARSFFVSSSSTQRTLAEIESIPEEKEEISEDIASFKPSEKSLQSILSSLRSNVSSNERDSLGKRRRDSASEALLKLRLMHVVPELAPKSPRESKSPPKTPMPMSPRAPERFMAKYPQNSVSREASFSEEVSAKGSGSGELLDELPNASQLGMILDLSCSPIEGASRNVSRRESLLQLSSLVRKRPIIEEMAKKFWTNYKEWGTHFDEWNIGNDSGWEKKQRIGSQDGENIISDDALRQWCVETVQNLLYSNTSNASIVRNFRSEKALSTFMEQEMLELVVVEPNKRKEVWSEAVKARAERTSHVQLDPNRLLLAHIVYDQLGDWPTQQMLMESDLAVTEALLAQEEEEEQK